MNLYSFNTPLAAVKGIGDQTVLKCEKKGLHSVLDLLLELPLRYEDRSQRTTIAEAPLEQLVTIEVTVKSKSNYYKGRRSIQSAVLTDHTGKLKAMWFNTPYILDKLQEGQKYLFSGKVNQYKTMTQPAVENLAGEHIHTDRLVPIYTSTLGLKPGMVRRVLKRILDDLTTIDDPLVSIDSSVMSLLEALNQVHFPDREEELIVARERLALEELLHVIAISKKIKDSWKHTHAARAIPAPASWPESFVDWLPTLPYELTPGQTAAVKDIITDLQEPYAMNRLLVGDVGSGKTVVAGLAALHTVQSSHSAALIAPTQILAEQHYQTLTSLFPNLPLVLLTSTTKKTKIDTSKPLLVVGTHSVINKITEINPALVIFDEQHRFGVAQRSQQLSITPHTLTMSATPIPRTMLLTLFAHLHLSTLPELPAGRIPTKTWLVPPKKTADAYEWLAKEMQHTGGQAFIVCPFIDPAHTTALENVAAVNQRYEELAPFFEKYSLSVALLHGKQSKTQQAEVMQGIQDGSIKVLVSTPIVEVGVNIPNAHFMVIEGAERFGLASLHQLRGRVGRGGQQGYCLVAPSSAGAAVSERLQAFTKLTNGFELAEIDMRQRGAGDLFGTRQHGFDDLRFADWSNLELIAQAKQLFDQLKKNHEHWAAFGGHWPKATDPTSLAAN